MYYFVFLFIPVFAAITITAPADFSIAASSAIQTLSWTFSSSSSITCSINSYLGEISFPGYTGSGVSATNSLSYTNSAYYQRASFTGTASQMGNAFASAVYQPHQFYSSNTGSKAVIEQTDYIEIVCTDGSTSASSSTMVAIGTGWRDDPTCGGNNCDSHGWCDKTTGTCYCWSPYKGSSSSRCDELDCGVCKHGSSCDYSTGKCTCTSSTYSGDHCEIVACTAATCNGNGWCNPTNGVCQCYSGYTGETCSLIYCLNNCNGNGVCNMSTGTCTCATNYFGTDCSFKKCPRDCGAYGGCNYSTGECKCYGTYSAKDCYFATCPVGTTTTTTCSSNGVCNYYTGECVCNSGYVGVDCSLTSA